MENKKTFLFLLICSGWAPMATAGRKGNYQAVVNKHHQRPAFNGIAAVSGIKIFRQDNWLLEQEKKREEKQQASIERMIDQKLYQRNLEPLRGSKLRTFRLMMHDARKNERLSALAKLTDEEREKLKKDSEKQLEKEWIAYEARLAQEQRSNERIRLMKEEQRFYMILRADYNREKMLAGLAEGESGRARVEAEFVQSVEKIRALEKRDKAMMLPRLWDLANIPSDVEGKQSARNILDAAFPGAKEYFKLCEAHGESYLSALLLGAETKNEYKGKASAEEIAASIRYMLLLI